MNLDFFKKNITLSSVLFIISFYFARHLFFINRIISPSEEGYQLFVYNAIEKGKLLYSQIDYHHGIGTPLFFSYIFRFFGAELLTVRIFALIFVAGSTILLYLILRKNLPNKWAVIYSICSFVAFYFPFYDYGYTLANFVGYTALFFAVSYIYERNRYYYYLSLFFCALTFLNTPYQEGIAFTGSIFISILFYEYFTNNIRFAIKHIPLYFFGIIILVIIFNGYYIANVGINAIIDTFFPPVSGIETTYYYKPFVFDFLRMYESIKPNDLSIYSLHYSVKTFLYTFMGLVLPLFCLIHGAKKSIKKRKSLEKKDFLTLIFTILPLLSTIRIFLIQPEYSSGAFLIAPGIAGSLYFLYHIIKDTKFIYILKNRLYVSVQIFVLAIFYLYIQIPYINQTFAEVKSEFNGVNNIYMTNGEYQVFESTLKVIKENTGENDKILVMDWSGLILSFSAKRDIYLADELMLFYLTIITELFDYYDLPEAYIIKVTKIYLDVLKNENPKVIIFSEAGWQISIKFFPQIEEYLKNNYTLEGVFGDFPDKLNVNNGTYHEFGAVRVFSINK